MAYVTVARAQDVAPGAAACVEAGGKRIALYNVDGTFYATQEACLHRGGHLAEGFLDGEVITCPLHAWQFNVKSGQHVMAGQIKLETYPVRVEGDEVQVDAG